MKVSLILAVSENGVIGRDNRLPWHLSADLRRFRQLTMGHHILMGRRTWESIGKPLPGRTSVVLTRGSFEAPAGVLVAPSLDQALDLARAAGETEAFVLGGSAVFEAALPRTDRVYLTRVLAAVEGDVRFDPAQLAAFRTISSEEVPAGPKDPFPTRFEILER